MRAYKVSTVVSGNTITRFAGSQADAALTRRDIMRDYSTPMASVEIEGVDIPTAKSDLLAFINKLL